ncbi:MAG: polyprenyl synthetase family protein [Myxococcaceae bacterium]
MDSTLTPTTPARTTGNNAPASTEWMGSLWAAIEAAMVESLQTPDEDLVGASWGDARSLVTEFALRPAKRIRPMLTVIGHQLATGVSDLSPDALRGGVAVELLHTFLLIHDDVADRAETRRAKPSLHKALGAGRAGDNLAIVLGDHLFARSVEVMLRAGSRFSVEATLSLLQACRFTAAGQLLDLQLVSTPLPKVTLFQALKVAHLKTARYSFIAPLVCGAILGGGSAELKLGLERIGRHAGLAFQLQDDLLGLFGIDATLGKSGAADYCEGKKTFPVVAAFARADARARARLERLWARQDRGPDAIASARLEVERLGGREATERVIARSIRAAERVLDSLPAPEVPRLRLKMLLSHLTHPNHRKCL